ncbi:unnamed protein product, partial [Hymenolepis diminuta]
MAVEGIHVAREIRDAGGGGGSEWDDSMWSLSCTESEDQSSETNAPISGTPRSFPSEATKGTCFMCSTQFTALTDTNSTVSIISVRMTLYHLDISSNFLIGFIKCLLLL